jgi:hypothetical protein
MDREQMDKDLATLDQYDVDQNAREDETRKGIDEYDRKVRALKNLTKLEGSNSENIEKQIENHESAKELDQDRLGSYKKVRRNYDIDEPMDVDNGENKTNFDNVIRGLDKQINTLDENDPEFDEDYKKLMRRREALIKLNSDRK